MPREMIPEDEIERWVTVHGVRVPIRKGQSEKDVTDNVEKEMGMEPTYEDSYDYDEFKKKNFKKLKELWNKSKDRINAGEDVIKEEWYKTRLAEEKKNLHEIKDIDEAFDILHENIPQRYLHMWFVEADSDIKRHIVDSLMMNKGTLNAALNIAYFNYREDSFERYSRALQKWIPYEGVDQSKKMSFETWLNTPQELWRGDRGQKEVKSDIFRSYSTSKKIAAGFTFGDSGSHKVTDEEMKNINPKNLTSIKIKPIDTLGSYSTNGEREYLVPKIQLRKH